MYGKSRYLQSGVITRELLTGITFPLTRTHREPEPYFISVKNPTRGQLVQSPGLSSRNRILSAALRSSAQLCILPHSGSFKASGSQRLGEPDSVTRGRGKPHPNSSSLVHGPLRSHQGQHQDSPLSGITHVPTVARQGFLLRTEDPHSQGRPARWRHRAFATSLSQKLIIFFTLVNLSFLH